jgi:UDP-N-acetylglucosamine 2-epimerase
VPKKLAVVLGIRPDVIRASLMLRELKAKLGDGLHFIWSGQHYSDNMKDVFFRQLNVPEPDVTLELDTSSDTSLIGSLIEKLGEELRSSKPEAVVFLGDTNTVVASLAVASLDIPIVHIEGCMRSYDWRMPEEKFRTTIDHLADVIYAYLPEYKQQGVLEGLDPDRIIVTGNPIVDVLDQYFISGAVRMGESEVQSYLAGLGVTAAKFWTMTCHRRENVESAQALNNIMGLAAAAVGPVIFPAGYRTQAQLKALSVAVPENVILVDPIGYAELMELIVRSQSVITDSGTIVEEAAVLGVPSIQMRTSTERPQVYDCGGSIKFDPHAEYSHGELEAVISSGQQRLGGGWSHTLGDGKASERIVDDLIARFDSNDWRGHKPNGKLRPIDRNFGYGFNDLGRP